ncbi:unnamed protein product [Spirodela intermedia]|uniref:Cystatin domain-containing protein n=2 Tax=Spirodela intermedia TaxID=51605 RepID=A0A7I8KEG9_SPIIN|nr:unnamed protein product [Spirodela intermedia]CAA6659170.1 unnamed protein product [Spirodela intermedia]CAA7395477.1 unnamed protein product [Spirodela intermedia]CAA7395488.1 unnamed protein product [Spirodela intermedia]
MTNINHRPLLFFLFLFGSVGSQSTIPGRFYPIEVVNDPHIQEIGEFAVSENNKQSGVQLVFIRVISGEKQVVAGINFRLVVEAKEGEAVHQYETLVYEQVWTGYRQLTSFTFKA